MEEWIASLEKTHVPDEELEQRCADFSPAFVSALRAVEILYEEVSETSKISETLYFRTRKSRPGEGNPLCFYDFSCPSVVKYFTYTVAQDLESLYYDDIRLTMFQKEGSELLTKSFGIGFDSDAGLHIALETSRGSREHFYCEYPDVPEQDFLQYLSEFIDPMKIIIDSEIPKGNDFLDPSRYFVSSDRMITGIKMIDIPTETV